MFDKKLQYIMEVSDGEVTSKMKMFSRTDFTFLPVVVNVLTNRLNDKTVCRIGYMVNHNEFIKNTLLF